MSAAQAPAWCQLHRAGWHTEPSRAVAAQPWAGIVQRRSPAWSCLQRQAWASQRAGSLLFHASRLAAMFAAMPTAACVAAGCGAAVERHGAGGTDARPRLPPVPARQGGRDAGRRAAARVPPAQPDTGAAGPALASLRACSGAAARGATALLSSGCCPSAQQGGVQHACSGRPACKAASSAVRRLAQPPCLCLAHCKAASPRGAAVHAPCRRQPRALQRCLSQAPGFAQQYEAPGSGSPCPLQSAG